MELQVAAESDMFVADATFSSAPRDFCQVLTVHCKVANDTGYEWMPILHACMRNKTAESYSVIFAAMQRRWKAMKVAVRVKKVLTDFEEALMSSVEDNFGREAVKGCLFHYSQAVLRNVRRCGLMRSYNEKGIIHEWIRRIVALPLLPPEHIYSAWDIALKTPPEPPLSWVPPRNVTGWPRQELGAFKKYFESYWLRMPLERWNHFKGDVRTTNAAEAYHSLLSRKWRSPRNPSMSGYLSFLQSRHSEHLTRIAQLLNGDKTRPRTRRYMRMNLQLLKYMRMYEVQTAIRKPATPLDVWLIALPYLDRAQHLLSDTGPSGLQTKKTARSNQKHLATPSVPHRKRVGGQPKSRGPTTLTAATAWHSEQVEVLSVTTESRRQITFNPPTLEFMKRICEKRLPAVNVTRPPYRNTCTFPFRKRPPQAAIVPVTADGNCFYRAIAYCITGSEEHHHRMRSLLSAFIASKKNDRWIQLFMNTATYKSVDEMLQWKKDLAASAMDERRWGDDVDLMAAALCLDVNIYVYTSMALWQGYFEEIASTGSMFASPNPHRPTILLQNNTGCHFEPVLGFQ